jgi:hypothetical protein
VRLEPFPAMRTRQNERDRAQRAQLSTPFNYDYYQGFEAIF